MNFKKFFSLLPNLYIELSWRPSDFQTSFRPIFCPTLAVPCVRPSRDSRKSFEKVFFVSVNHGRKRGGRPGCRGGRPGCRGGAPPMRLSKKLFQNSFLSSEGRLSVSEKLFQNSFLFTCRDDTTGPPRSTDDRHGSFGLCERANLPWVDRPGGWSGGRVLEPTLRVHGGWGAAGAAPPGGPARTRHHRDSRGWQHRLPQRRDVLVACT